MEGLVSQRTMLWVLIVFDVVMLAWWVSGVSERNLVATVWLVGLGTWAVAWAVTRPRRPAAKRSTKGRR